MNVNVIKILGTGCKKCVSLEENAKEAVKELGMDAEIVHVTDLKEITEYGVMSTPALVVDEKVVCKGKVLKPRDIITLLQK